MKKLFLVISIILISSNFAYSKGTEFYLSCKGSIHILSPGLDTRESFFQDISLDFFERDNKKRFIKYKNEETNYYMYRETFFLDGMKHINFNDYKIVIDKPLHILSDGVIVKQHYESLSLKNGRLKIIVEVQTDKNDKYTQSYLEVNAVCSGANKIYAYLKNEVPGINIKDNEIVPASSGTGFFISKDGHIISNNHVVEGCSIIKAIYGGKEFEAKILSTDKVNDLAILKTNINPNKVYSVSKEDGQLLEEVIVAGYPLGKKISAAIKATSGTVTALAGLGDNYAEFQTDAALNSGNSGGPIINEFGNVIGVAVSKIQQQGVESFNFGIKSSVLKIFIKANGIKLLPPNKQEMKKKDLGSLITEATIYLDCWMTGKELKKLIAQSQKSQKAFYSQYKN